MTYPFYLVMGVSGSGKTSIGQTMAARLDALFIDADDLHSAENVAHMRAGHPLTDEMRWPWLTTCAETVVTERTKHPVILACSALRRIYRDKLRATHPDLRLIYPVANRDLIADRMSKRQGHYMPVSLLDSQFATLEEPTSDERAICVPITGSVEDIVNDILDRI